MIFQKANRGAKHTVEEKPKNENEPKLPLRCECCNCYLENESLSIFCKLSDLSFSGIGLPLYFGFIRAMVLLLMLLGMVYSSYGLYSNLKGSFCIDAPKGVSLGKGLCYKNIFNQNSLINKVN